MVDASDTERFNDAKFELDYLITQEEGKSAPLLVLANKADLPNADTIEHIIEQLGLNQIKGRPWHIQFTCATKGEGLVEGLDWLHQVLTKKELKALASQVSLTPLTGSP
jgi:signal recognition particle receptor subunit beta